MKLVRLFLMSGFAFLAFSGVAAAQGAPAPSTPAALTGPIAPALATPISTTASSEGTTTTYSDGMQLFTPASPDAVSDCAEQWFCLWENNNFSGGRAQWHDSGSWQEVPSGFGASSFYNHRNNSSYIEGSPGTRCFPPGGAGNFGEDWNDKAVATYLESSVTC
jgi:hypothetical protein